MNQNEFFQACVGSYPEAMLSIAIFRQYVQDVCTKMLSKRAPELEVALGLPRGELKFLPYADPDRLILVEPKSLTLGAKAKTSDGEDRLWAYLYWKRQEALNRSGSSPTDSESYTFGLEVDISGDKGGEFYNALAIAVDRPPFCDELWWELGRFKDPRYAGLYMYLNEPKEISVFNSKLDSLIEKAIALIKSVKEGEMIKSRPRGTAERAT
jgi:hypothetical protein